MCCEQVNKNITEVFGLGLACQAKGQCCHTKKSSLAKIFTKKKQVKVRSTACHNATKKDPLKNNVFRFGHHN